MLVVKKFYIKKPLSSFVRYRLISLVEKINPDILNISKLEQTDDLSISQLYDLNKKIGDDRYFNKMYDRVYSLVDENEPTKQKIFCRYRNK